MFTDRNLTLCNSEKNIPETMKIAQSNGNAIKALALEFSCSFGDAMELYSEATRSRRAKECYEKAKIQKAKMVKEGIDPSSLALAQSAFIDC